MALYTIYVLVIILLAYWLVRLGGGSPLTDWSNSPLK